MLTNKLVRMLSPFLVVIAAQGIALAQDPTRLNLTIELQSIRFSTPDGDVLDWRMQVVNAQGQPIYDSELLSGSALTWALVDSQGQGIDGGIYSYTLSLRGAGRQRRRQGQLLVQKTVNGYQVWALSDSQAGLAGNGETILTVTDDSTSGDPSPTSAALPTNLGRASFGAVAGYISGTGTTNVMTKWVDGPGGVVGDTTLSEYAGAVTIGNGSYYGNLQIFGGAGNDVFAGMGPNIVTGPAFNFGYAGGSFGRSAGFFNVRPDASAVPPNPSLRFMTANSQRMIITNTGDVGIGTTTPEAKFVVHAPDTSSGTRTLWIEDSNGVPGLAVYANGQTYVRTYIPSTSTGHVCRDSNYLSTCGSAAEYVPTVASVPGYPETADLVSLSVTDKNPYGDDHAPFVVAKSNTVCDEHLLGFIVNPESGADGKKVNDHYFPLAIYGYFPAKVTTENGPIRRGDGITSSSTPGAGMKATGACKIIGYALEDADRDGSIQVFAHFGEQARPELVALRGKFEVLTGENEALKRELTRIDARVTSQEVENASLRERLAAVEALLRQLARESPPKALIRKELR